MNNLRKNKIKKWLYNLSTLWILLIIIVAVSIIKPTFLQPSNLSTFITQSCFLFLLGAAELVVILTGGIDLSIGATMTISTIICGEMMTEKSGTYFLIPIILVILICAGIGLVNGLLVTKLRIPSFLATFATMYICRGGAWLYIGAGVYYNLNSTLRFMAIGELFSIGGFRVVMPMVIVGIFAILLNFILKKTTWGRRLYFTGANCEASRFTGIQTDLKITEAYVLCSMIAGLAAIMYTAKLNAVDAALGSSYPFDGLTVALIGGAIMTGGFGDVFGMIMGALIVSAINSGMTHLRVPTELQKALLGLAMIGAVFLSQAMQNKKLSIADIDMDTNDDKSLNTALDKKGRKRQ